jgi:hypothetical protein
LIVGRATGVNKIGGTELNPMPNPRPCLKLDVSNGSFGKHAQGLMLVKIWTPPFVLIFC